MPKCGVASVINTSHFNFGYFSINLKHQAQKTIARTYKPPNELPIKEIVFIDLYFFEVKYPFLRTNDSLQPSHLRKFSKKVIPYDPVLHLDRYVQYVFLSFFIHSSIFSINIDHEPHRSYQIHEQTQPGVLHLLVRFSLF
eukprot:UN01510